ncbi:MAG: helix-turn-helix domain-containing protein, partial [Bdellovibrionales bacterium]|nr:helix-turn-helix domain-containing protein [Bdellovibrionales bacterium]
METFGAYIKAQRENKGIRLEEIASITKIHIHALQHLEAGRWEKLPPEPFLRGFVIAYAKYVGLDTQECLNRYLDEKEGPSAKKQGEEKKQKAPEKETVAAKRTASKTPARKEIQAPPAQKTSTNQVITESNSLPLAKVAGIGIALVLVALISGLIYVGKNGGQDAPPMVVSSDEPTDSEQALLDEERTKNLFVDLKLKVEDEPNASPAPVESPSPAFAPSPTPVATATTVTETSTREAAALNPPAHKVVVQGLARTWMKVIIDDNPPIEYFLPKGKSAGYAANSKIKVVVGDHNGVRVTHNSEEVNG